MTEVAADEPGRSPQNKEALAPESSYAVFSAADTKGRSRYSTNRSASSSSSDSAPSSSSSGKGSNSSNSKNSSSSGKFSSSISAGSGSDGSGSSPTSSQEGTLRTWEQAFVAPSFKLADQGREAEAAQRAALQLPPLEGG
eukprot:CAMPEP_0115475496 /NCGR_PEP_ID=MMETSP0271-20121206/54645_1 /TAXON_ID=71861 /ORGANISM="Scrippsiella trochoidea, Strain CCMP3099" /LENGTH=139 /DNA_ID=CAMNT_0002902867 /DNA_START=19 /DNA_END=434 /DNA_ORIENTATION=-